MGKLPAFVILLFLVSCNSSTTKNKQAMDDTARMRDPLPAANITATAVPGSDLPSSIRRTGTFQKAFKWNDNNGENILVFSSRTSKEKDEGGEMGETGELFAQLYKGKDGQYTEVWKFHDQVTACTFDITSRFLHDAVTITDLDKDGTAEVKMQYLKACRSDVSPAGYFLVMYENHELYSLKGLTWLSYKPDMKFLVTEENVNLEKTGRTNIDNDDDYEYSFGRYESEKDFAGAPVEFLQHARKEWIKFAQEKIGE